MAPLVALHETTMTAVSPAAVKPMAVKSTLWFCCRATILGDIATRVGISPVSLDLMGISQATATAPTTRAIVGILNRIDRIRARRWDSLNVNGIVPPQKERAASFDLSRIAGGPAGMAVSTAVAP
jgi:hypothetical protein